MTSRDFAFWLQGFFEMTGAAAVTPEQTAMIKGHLDLVFKHDFAAMQHPPMPLIHQLTQTFDQGGSPGAGGAGAREHFHLSQGPFVTC